MNHQLLKPGKWSAKGTQAKVSQSKVAALEEVLLSWK